MKMTVLASPFLQRRLEKELNVLQSQPHTDVHIQMSTTSEYVIHCMSPYGRHYTFTVLPEYPFKPPLIQENGVTYELSGETNDDWLRQFSQDYNTCGCRCCHSLIRDSRWSPSFTLSLLWNHLVQNEKKWIHVKYNVLSSCPLLRSSLPSDTLWHVAQF